MQKVSPANIIYSDGFLLPLFTTGRVWKEYVDWLKQLKGQVKWNLFLLIGWSNYKAREKWNLCCWLVETTKGAEEVKSLSVDWLKHLQGGGEVKSIIFWLVPTAACCVDTDRIGAGCSIGGCGGYTPSGWNRIFTLHSLDCDDPCCVWCCPPPPCTCSCDEDGCCTCCTCYVKQKPQRKRKSGTFTCDPKVAGRWCLLLPSCLTINFII